MMSSPWRWFVVLGMLGGCGGRVVMETSDGGGGDGGGGAAGLSACSEWCEARTAECPYKGSCVEGCLETVSYLGPCVPEYEVLLLCHAAHPWLAPDCTPPSAPCDAELEAVKACVYPAGPCEVGQCVAGGGLGAPAMKCDFVCGGVVYTSACGEVTLNSSGYPKDCVCQVDGETIGTCQSVTPAGATPLGCCSAHFAESE